MTNFPIDFTVLKDSDHNPRRILIACKALREDMLEQGFKSDIESIYLLGCLLDSAEDAALVAILERS